MNVVTRFHNFVKMEKLIKKKSGQIWVETVIYMLIGLAIIGTLLAIIIPRYGEQEDKIIANQAINLLNRIDTRIRDLRYYGSGNTRMVKSDVKSGNLFIDGEKDVIKIVMESSIAYSEVGEKVKEDRIYLKTDELGDIYRVEMGLNYSGQINITYNGEEGRRDFPKSATAYELVISNRGRVSNDMTNIDFSLGN